MRRRRPTLTLAEALMSGLGFTPRVPQRPRPGLTPKELKAMAPAAGDRAVGVEVIEYGPSVFQRHQMADGREAESLADFLAQLPPEGAKVRWINVDGLGAPAVLAVLAEFYGLHPLAMEDVVHTHQRAKAEVYAAPGCLAPLYVVMRTVQVETPEGGAVSMHSEQVSAFVGPGLLVTIQETPGDNWNPVRRRLEDPANRLRQRGSDLLLHALIDGAVDSLFPMMEGYSDRIEAIEERVHAEESANIVHEIGALRRELMLVRRAVGPMRELSRQLMQESLPGIGDETRTYLRDVHDHAVQVVELIETYRDLAAGLSETWLGVQGHRMNQVMKALTLLTAIFIPITFLTSVYGMNFAWMPFLDHPQGFWMMSGLCAAVVAGMLAWFWRRKWF